MIFLAYGWVRDVLGGSKQHQESLATLGTMARWPPWPPDFEKNTRGSIKISFGLIQVVSRLLAQRFWWSGVLWKCVYFCLATFNPRKKLT